MTKLFKNTTLKLKNAFEFIRSPFVIIAYYMLFYALNLRIIEIMGITEGGNEDILLFWTLGFITIFMFIAFFFKPTIRKVILFSFFAFTIILGAFDIAYYASYKEIPSIVTVQNAEDLWKNIGSNFFASEAWKLFLYLPVFIAIMMLDKIQATNRIKRLISTFCVIIFLFTSSLTFFSTAEAEWDRFTSDFYLLDSIFVPEDAYLTFGVYGYHAADVVNVFTHQATMRLSNNEDIDQYFAEKDVDTSTNEATGVFEGKNLVMIQVESLSPMAINSYSTPNMQYMKDNGIYFDNFYQSTYYGNTSDAEFSSQTGMMANLEEASVYTNTNNYFPGTLPKLFKAAGYNTYGSHCNNGEFYNRRNNYPNLYGFENSYFQEDLDVHEVGYYYQPDTVCLEEYYEKIDTSEPFYMFFVSVSSHNSYNVESQTWTDEYYDEVDSIPGSENFNEEMRVYMAKLAKFDEALGNLVKELKADGVYEDTVFILYGDHIPPLTYGIYDVENETNPNVTNKVPLIIYTPGITPSVNQTLGAEYDLAPTVANLFNLDPNHEYTKYYYGVDLYSDNHSRVVHKNKEYLYNGDMSHEEIKAEVEIYQKILSVDYFRTMQP